MIAAIHQLFKHARAGRTTPIMPTSVRSTLLLALTAPFVISAAEPDALGRPQPVQLAQVGARERIVIRIPHLPRASRRHPASDTQWREKKGPKCVAARSIASARMSADGDVDLIITDGRRLRAELNEHCPTLKFYNGFYLRRAADGNLCARRDSLRSRSGARCQISRLRTLVPGK